ncbi:hypothetical protein FQR65_LT21015 [Abscondita terminalis]|nr:hypothetical protein FQR65_LT21015 [Abscondita terminalis]
MLNPFGNRERRARTQGSFRVGFRLHAPKGHLSVGSVRPAGRHPIGQGAARHHTGIRRGVRAQMTGGGTGPLAFPVGGDACAARATAASNGLGSAQAKTSPFEVVARRVENQVNEIARSRARRARAVRCCSAVHAIRTRRPHETQRIAQQAAQRAGRLGVRRCRVAAQKGFVATPGEQRAATQETPVAVAPSARQNDGGGRGGEDRLEVAAVGEVDRQRVEHLGRDDMVRDQPVLGDPARPARGMKPEEPHEAAGRCRERAGRHPGDADARFQSVVLLQGFHRGVDRGGGAGEQSLAPDRQRAALEEGFSDLAGGRQSFHKGLDRRAQRRNMVGTVRPVFWRQPGQQAAPGAWRRERRIGRQHPQPAFGQGLERPAVPAERREAAQPRLRQAANYDVGQRRSRLALAGGDGADAMDEVKVDVASARRARK